MPNIKRQLLTILILFPVLLSSSLIAQADTLYEIQTGEENSASWQFTQILSRIWQQKYQDKRSYFIPKQVNGFYKRFQNLNAKSCKLIIAPLKSISELPITGMQIKIVTVLWSSYLAPININADINEVGLQGHHNWLIPENSLILPQFIEGLKQSYDDASGDIKPELASFVQSVNWPLIKLTDDESNQLTDNGVTTHTGSNETPTSETLTISESSNGFIKPIKRSQINQLYDGNQQGILFYEMLGPYSNLLNAFQNQYKIVSLESSFINYLLKYTWYLEPFNIDRLGVRTVGITYALFVNESEDPEFVKSVLEAIAQQPRTYFPTEYLLENLSINETKEISPLFLHESAIEFFNID